MPTTSDLPTGGVRAATSGRGPAVRALVALIAGLALGIAVVSSGSATAARAVSWIEPLGTLWVNAIRMTIIPLIVSSLLVAVAAAGGRAVGRLGVRAFVIFVALLSLVALVTTLLAPPLFARLVVDPAAAQSIRAAATAVDRPELPTFVGWLVSLVPANPIRAAADGAMLPLIVFTLTFALALGRLAEETRGAVVLFFQGVADAMTVVVQWVLAAAPLGVFALAVGLATRLGAGVVGAVAFYLAAHSALIVVAIALVYVVVAAFGGVSPLRFARAALPAQIVAATTRSSMAALPSAFTAAEQALGLPRAVTSFALPLAVSVFRLNQAVSWVAMALFASKLYGVPLGTEQVVSLAVTSVLMSFSVPGIPSGSLFVVAPFFAAVGIPPESVGVLIALDLVPDLFKTPLNVTGHIASVALLARGERAVREVREVRGT